MKPHAWHFALMHQPHSYDTWRRVGFDIRKHPGLHPRYESMELP